ncbi:hypothetical protein EXIGLDRAFT_719703 [Exidia glandulosa HHB12029]|uniref:Mso1 N-terminal domain-containing protein n=1 Tax=Exidia glandulosa HHB12029 TaxID=1314781 RepID=A0A165GVI1_EXIGL|nr:hypothetical protein EXIGLDRAFT_719703 [Exidia glandulosa HHB12029]
MSLRTHRAGGLPSNPRSRSPNPSQGRDNYSGYNDPPDALFSSSRSSSRSAQGLPGSVRPERSTRRPQQPPQDDYGSQGRASSEYGARGNDRYGRGDDRYGRDDRYGGNDNRYPQQSSSSRTGSAYDQQSSAGYDDRPNSTSTSSSASSLLDRMKQRGVSSARTSIDDDPPPPTKAATSLRTRSKLQQQQQYREPSPEYEPSNEPVPSGEGSSIWGRMVAATTSLRVNVSTAISNVTREDGEETPPGQESRLTRAMKEYYLRKARDPNDLPTWLFEPAERTVSSKPSNISSTTTSSSRSRPSARDEPPPPTQSRGLRDIYERAQQQQQAPLARSPTLAQRDGVDSRAASRLKALREAKRSAVGATREYDQYYRSDQQQQYEPEPEPEPRRPARVGLPSRPGGGGGRM